MSDDTIRSAGDHDPALADPNGSDDALVDGGVDGGVEAVADDLVIVPVSDTAEEGHEFELFEADASPDETETADVRPTAAGGAVRVTDDSEVGRNVVVECPGCGLVCEGVDPRPTAAWFCPNCDYPLFLAAPAPPAVAANSGLARRRLPGTDGREMVSAEACWACGERNPIGTTVCQRCNSQLVRPAPPVPLAAEPAAEETGLEPLIFVARRWPLILGGALGGSLLTLLIVILAVG